MVVATIIPIANDGTNQKVLTYNAALPGLVNARANAGKHVVLLDNYAAFSKDSSYRTTLMSDSLQPKRRGLCGPRPRHVRSDPLGAAMTARCWRRCRSNCRRIRVAPDIAAGSERRGSVPREDELSILPPSSTRRPT